MIDLEQIKTLCESIELPWNLDSTPLMPNSKFDPSYGGKTHRELVDVGNAVPELIAEVERLRKEIAQAVEQAASIADDEAKLHKLNGDMCRSDAAHWVARRIRGTALLEESQP